MVGVARDVQPQRFGAPENPALYREWRSHPVRSVITVRLDAGTSTGAAAARAAIRETDLKLLVIARLAQSWIDQVTEELWKVVVLIVILGVVATLLAGLWLSVATAAGLRPSFQGSPLRLDTANPLLYCGAALLLTAAAVLAMLSPARRGARSDPLSSLRCG